VRSSGRHQLDTELDAARPATPFIGKDGLISPSRRPDSNRGPLHYESRAGPLLGATGRFPPALSVTPDYCGGQEILSAKLSAPESDERLDDDADDSVSAIFAGENQLF
jgi:hypothetical protein